MTSFEKRIKRAADTNDAVLLCEVIDQATAAFKAGCFDWGTMKTMTADIKTVAAKIGATLAYRGLGAQGV